MSAIAPPQSGRIVSAVTTIKIGDWTATPVLDLLERDGQIVKLQPRAMELLIYLAGRADEVVSAQDLIKSVWRNRDVSDGAIYRSVKQLRQALGDDAEDSRYIQTVPNHGYRLIAAVEPLPPNLEIEGLAQGGHRGAGAMAAAISPFLCRALPFAATAIATAAVTAVAVWVGMQPEPLPVSRFTYTVPADQVFRRVGRAVLALSPDGRHFVYNTNDGLYLRTMDGLEAQVIPGTEEDLSNPFFSPDGQTVAYWSAANSELKRISLSGGAPVVIASDVSNPRGASWGADGTILYGQLDGIYRVAADGGRPERIIETPEGETLYGPQMLPDGDSVLYSVWTTEWVWDSTKIIAESLATGERKVLIEYGSDARFLPTGHIVFAREETLLAVNFDADGVTVSAGPVSLLDGVAENSEGNAAYGVADDGTLIYLKPEPSAPELQDIVWVDREGKEEPLIPEPRFYGPAKPSPDGQYLAVAIDDPNNGGNGDIWIYDVKHRNLRPLTFSEGHEATPIWTPDGQRVVYRTDNGLHWRAADGTGQAELLIEKTTARPIFPYSFSRDSKYFVFGQFGRDFVGQGYDIYIRSMETGTVKALIDDERAQYAATISPTGEWIAYMSSEKGRNLGQVFIRPFPNVHDGKWPISTDGAGVPVWGPDGKELFFLSKGSMMVMSAESDPPWSTVPKKLFSMARYSEWYFTHDGQRFVMMKSADNRAVPFTPQIVIVQNWIEELKRLAPAGGVAQSIPRDN